MVHWQEVCLRVQGEEQDCRAQQQGEVQPSLHLGKGTFTITYILTLNGRRGGGGCPLAEKRFLFIKDPEVKATSIFSQNRIDSL